MIDRHETPRLRSRPPLEKAFLFGCKRDKSAYCEHPECAPVVLEPNSNAVRILEALAENTFDGGSVACRSREERYQARKLAEAGNLRVMMPSEIADELGLHRSEVSRQLKALRKAGYVERERDGRNLYYRLTYDGVGAIGFARRNDEPGTSELLVIRYSIIPQIQGGYALVRDDSRQSTKLTLGTYADCENAFATLVPGIVEMSAAEQKLHDGYGDKVGPALDGAFNDSE